MYNCRTCLTELTENYITLNEDAEGTQIRKEISECVPEMSIDIVEDPVICQQCLEALHISHGFRMKCLETEKEINKYLRLTETTERLTSGILDIPSSRSSSPVNLVEDLTNRLTDVLELPDTPKGANQYEDAEEDIMAINAAYKRIFKGLEHPQPSLQNSLEALEEAIIDNINKEYELLPKSPRQVENDNEAINKDYEFLPEEVDEEATESDEINVDDEASETDEINVDDEAVETNKMNVCEQCGYQANSRHYLRVHQKETKHGFTCSVCLTSYIKESGFKNHFKNNKCPTMEEMKPICQLNPCSEEPFVCKVCKEAFKTLSLLKRHARCHNVKLTKKYSCTQCTYKTFRHRSFVTHTKAVCVFCDKKVNCNVKLKTHILDNHLTSESEIQEISLQICPVCKLTVGENLVQLLTHLKTHKHGTFFVCNFCSYNNSSWQEFQIHMQAHNKDLEPNQSLKEIQEKARFRCNQCTYQTRALASLNRHKLTHIPKKFSCPFCSFQTRTKLMLQKHKVIMHNFLSCNKCNFESASETDYRIHKNFHCEKNLISTEVSESIFKP